jgi:hypothetical protein
VKTLLCLALLLCPTCLRAEELLSNGDFSDGNDHWLGDGVAPSQLSPDNPLAASDANAENELIVPLRPHGWTKVSQAFHTHAAQYTFLIKFKTSPDVKFTKEKDEYDRSAEEIGLWTTPFYHQFNNFLYGIVDDSKRIWFAGYCNIINLKSPNPILERTMNNISVSDDKTIYLAFPPGEGNIVIKSISVMTP